MSIILTQVNFFSFLRYKISLLQQKRRNYDKRTIQIIKDCVPILQKNGEDLTNEFYKIMFNDYPEVKPMFNMEKQNFRRTTKSFSDGDFNGSQKYRKIWKI